MKVKIISNQEGMTLVEVMVAMLVMGISLVALTTMQVSSSASNVAARKMGEANTIASRSLEMLMGLSYDDPLWDDVDGDGNAGLEDKTAADADGNFMADYGGQQYSVFWNVSVDDPIPNQKTVQIIANRTEMGINRAISLNYVRMRDF